MDILRENYNRAVRYFKYLYIYVNEKICAHMLFLNPRDIYGTYIYILYIYTWVSKHGKYTVCSIICLDKHLEKLKTRVGIHRWPVEFPPTKHG